MVKPPALPKVKMDVDLWALEVQVGKFFFLRAVSALVSVSLRG